MENCNISNSLCRSHPFLISQQHLKKIFTALESPHNCSSGSWTRCMFSLLYDRKRDNKHANTHIFYAQIEIGLVRFIYQDIHIVQGSICACVISASGCAACLCIQRCVMMTSSSPGRHCGGYFDSLLCYCCRICPQIRACLLLGMNVGHKLPHLRGFTFLAAVMYLYN